MKLKFLKHKKQFKKGGFHTNPNVGWHLVLLITFILVMLSLVFGIYFLRRVSHTFSDAPEVREGQVKIVKKERISKVLEYFDTRAGKAEEIISSPATLVDPSL